MTVGDLQLDLGARRVLLAGVELELTRKELGLPARLMRDAGSVVSLPPRQRGTRRSGRQRPGARDRT